ncbi:hypothetical protein SAMN02927921_00318 [Sinomicrobium oceani]|uniref:DUF2071 domain-containing protein n=1 Tax=Sinomicrobium oceani TaxID=1150368 RepID=A0A1K1M1W9_9FLAO|nr:DUF2071 domain-containing protein [Sinomicrobium oceani]SFW17140.1 hypothetical protein SAMN02927921_00318 [Sinomicrobium oceani]
MTIKEILQHTTHRPWNLPDRSWKYYQEWNKAVFLHWCVAPEVLRKWLPSSLELDLYEGKAWVSVVAFTMEKIRPSGLPPFPPVSDFHEINIRTYVKYKGKSGVYFLSIEGGKQLSCFLARNLSSLPYRYSRMTRIEGVYTSVNQKYGDTMTLNYNAGTAVSKKTALDLWLTERYALFQDTSSGISAFEIHHIPWPLYHLHTKETTIHYPRFSGLLSGAPHLMHYSTGVQVIAWDDPK